MNNKAFKQRMACVLAVTMGVGMAPWSGNFTVYAQEQTVQEVSNAPIVEEAMKVEAKATSEGTAVINENTSKEESKEEVKPDTKEEVQSKPESKEEAVTQEKPVVKEEIKLEGKVPLAVKDEKESSALTVAEAKKQYIEGEQENVCIEAYIVGYVKSTSNAQFDADTKVNTNIILSDNKNESNKENVISVKLYGTNKDNTTNIRKEYSLLDEKSNLGRKVKITGKFGDYYGFRGFTLINLIEEVQEGEQKLDVYASPAGGTLVIGDEIKLSTTTGSALIFYAKNDAEEKQYDFKNPIKVEKEDKGALKLQVRVENTAKPEDKVEKIFDYTVKDLNDISIQDIRKEKDGQAVTFTGTVTRCTDFGLYVQDDTAAIYVYGSKSAKRVKSGDVIRVTGNLKNYSELLEVENSEVEIIGDGKIIEPEQITIKEFLSNGEKYESKLIAFNNVKMGAVNTSGATKIEDGTGTVDIFKAPLDKKIGYDSYHVVVLGAQHNEGYQLTLASEDDVTPLSGMQKLSNMVLKQDDELKLPETLQVIENGKAIDKPITWNKEDVAKVDTSKIDNYTVRGTVEGGVEISIVVQVITKGDLRICDIQGKGHQSPFMGAKVENIRGIVTGTDKVGFYMQCSESDDDGDDATSEGIYVKNGDKNYKPQVGNLVSVTGVVKENLGYTTNPNSDKDHMLKVTQIDAKKVEKKENSVTLPKPVVIGTGGRIAPNKIIDNDSFAIFDPEEDAIDFYESLEGMLVQVNDAQVVGGTSYNEIIVVPDKGIHSANELTPQGGVVITEDNMHPERIFLADSTGSRNRVMPLARVGNIFEGTVQGVMSYNDGNYKLLVDAKSLPALDTKTNEYDVNRATHLTETENGLRIATFNVENLGGNEKQDKFDSLAKMIANNLQFPDIVALEEVQDNSGKNDDGTVEADIVYKRLIEAIESQKGTKDIAYDYVEIAPEDKVDGGQPGGNIRIGMIYNTKRVSLKQGSKKGDAVTATQAVKDAEGKASLSLNPGRVTPQSPHFKNTRKSLVAQFVFKGEEVVVIGNHLGSKRGDGPTFGNEQPPVLGSEPRRIEQTRVINNFVKELLAVNPNTRIVVLGDLNDFHYSKPVKTIMGDELYNMAYKLPENQRYSYNFQGNSQTLDNMLVTKGLEKFTDIDILNINSCFGKYEQITDHDPGILCIDMSKPFVADTKEEPSSGSGGSHKKHNSNKNNNKVEEEIKDKEQAVKEVKLTDDLKVKETKEEKVVFEVKDGSKLAENVKVELDAKLMKSLGENKKDLAIKTAKMVINVPYNMIKEGERVSIGAETVKVAKEKAIKEMPETLKPLAAYKFDVKVAGKEVEALEKGLKVEMELPKEVNNANKVAAYILKDGKREYIDTRVKGGKIALNLKADGLIVIAESTKTFKDIKGHWAQEEIEILAAKELVVGVGADKFSPKEKLTRKDFAIVLSKFFNGEIEKDAKEELVTRAQMAVMLKNALEANEIKQESIVSKEEFAKFKDLKNTTTEEKAALEYMVEIGLLKGISKTKISPNTVLTRAEMSAVIGRLLKQMN